jgi:hypothetical protein
MQKKMSRDFRYKTGQKKEGKVRASVQENLSAAWKKVDISSIKNALPSKTHPTLIPNVASRRVTCRG